MVSIYQCPVCNRQLERQDRQYICGHGHSFDIARQGYVNLLLAHHKRSADPGDDRGMVANRRAFLAAGHYDRLAASLAELVWAALGADRSGAQLLDAGCGEGFYLRHLAVANQVKDGLPVGLWGLDISKFAVSAAAGADQHSHYCVGSSFRLPIRSACLDAVMQVFAPGDPDECRRVLKPAGRLIVMAPGPEHLYGLKEAIYAQPQKHPQPSSPSGFKQIADHRTRYRLTLEDNRSVQRLLCMTPYYWHLDRCTQERALALAALDTAVDAVLQVYQVV